jgi:hypothetical protein
MFCPICRAEYLPGPKVCSDCQVPLVDVLPEKGATTVSDSDDSGASVKIWGGIDPRTFAAIRAALDESHIVHDDVTRESPISSIYSPEPMQIWIGKADGLAAQKILEGIVGHDEAAGLTPDAELARDSAEHNPFGLGRTMFSRVPGEEDAASEEVELAEPEPDEGPVPDDLVENFDPEEATCEVWAGGDEQMAQIFKECLQNVGIGCVVNEAGGKARLLVLPSAEKRAREVIREIVDEAPPG